MNSRRPRLFAPFLAASIGLAIGSAALGSPGGAHMAAGGGGGHAAGAHAGSPYHGHAGYAGAYPGGWHGGGWHGGWRGPYYGWGFWGTGLFLATLPWYYNTYWWGGVPYYYVDNGYYTWDSTAGVYVASPRPAGPPDNVPPSAAQAPTAPASLELFMYPKGGQSPEQQAKDRYECHHWASEQIGFDPTQPGASVPADQVGAKRAEYLRADAACLEGRNYSVK